MAMALPPVPSSFYNGFVYVGEALLAAVPNVWLYAPYAFGLGAVGYVGDWLKENRPRGNSEMMDDFYKYTADGTVDLAKFVTFGYSGTGPNGGGSASHQMLGYASMSPSSYGSTAMRWGSSGGGLMGASNPGVNRVAGQY
jgi:hypothetical protein